VVDDPINPREGYSFSAEVRVAPALGDAAFAQARLESRWLQPIGAQDRLLLRAQAGALWTDDFSSLPPQLRFFAGGDRSLRGFGYQTLGPRNSRGFVRGGEFLAIASAEYERHLFDEYGIAGFVDAGNAFDSGDTSLAAAIGVGVRWRSPVGLVRLDLAQPVAGDGDGLRLHLLIGPEL
jgi:translocation and assembly module TamA